MQRFAILVAAMRLLQAVTLCHAVAHFMDCTVPLEGPQLWKQVFLCGTELEQLEEVYRIRWDFSHLDEALQEDGFIDSSLQADARNKVYLFGSTEPQMVKTDGENTTVVPIPVIIAVNTSAILPEKLALNSVQMENEQVVPMSAYKMSWLPLAVPKLTRREKRLRLRGAEEGGGADADDAGAATTAGGGSGQRKGRGTAAGQGGGGKREEQHEGGGGHTPPGKKRRRPQQETQVWGLACSQRKAPGVLKNIKEERTRMFDYCMPYIFLPHKQPQGEAQQDTVVDIICNLPGVQAPLVFDFDWEMDDAEDMAKEKVEEEEVDPKHQRAIEDAIREAVEKAKAEAEAKAAEKRKQVAALSEADAEALRALTTVKFYPRNDKCSDVKSKYINRYYGQADQVL